MTRAGTYPLSSIDRIQIYFNTKKRKSTKANLKKILLEEGGDIIMNAAIFLRNGDPCCHLKADGKVKCQPGGYNAWAISWNTPLDFAVEVAPNSKANYMACVKCIINRQKVVMDYQPDMNYKAPPGQPSAQRRVGSPTTLRRTSCSRRLFKTACSKQAGTTRS